MRFSRVILQRLLLTSAFVLLSELCLGQAKYFVPQKNASRIIIDGMDLALSKLNITEVPAFGNSGKDVKEFLSSVNLREGNSWCAAFCQWAYRMGAAKNGSNLNMIISGHCLTILRYAAQVSISSFMKPSFGDWIIFRRGEGQNGHAALLIEFRNDTLITLEGNIRSDDNKNDGVFIRKRSIKKFGWLALKGFIRFGEWK